MEVLSPRDYHRLTLKSFIQSNTPCSGTFELTARCTLDCKMCYVHTPGNKKYIKDELPGSWWINVIDQAYANGMMFAVVTGGECLLHKDFKEIYLHLFSLGIRIHLKTNATLINEDWIKFFTAHPPSEITVSVYGSDEESYEAVTCHRAFDKVLSSIIMMKEACLNICATITPSSFNKNSIASIKSVLTKNHIPYSLNADLFDPNEETGKSIQDISCSEDEKIQYLREIVSTKFQNPEVLPPCGGDGSKAVKGIRCNSGRSSFFITWNGYIQPCSAFHMKKIKFTNFNDSWAEINSIMRNYQTPIECFGCKYKKVCFSCAKIRNGQAPEGHCDPKVCSLTVRKVREGLVKFPEE